MPTAYSASIIGAMADRLYRRAIFCEVFYTLTGLVVGIAAGVQAMAYVSQNVSDGDQLAIGAVLVLTLIGLAIGYEFGSRAALRLRFQAQQALVLVEIERHTAAA